MSVQMNRPSLSFFFNDTATTEIYTLSLHDALPISAAAAGAAAAGRAQRQDHRADRRRSEEHTSELQSPCKLVCRLLLEKKKSMKIYNIRLFNNKLYLHITHKTDAHC